MRKFSSGKRIKTYRNTSGLTTAQMFVALEEMPPWTGYHTLLFDPVFALAPAVILVRTDETVPGSYLLAIFQSPYWDMGVQYDIYAFHEQIDFAAYVADLLTMQKPGRWRDDANDQVVAELREGLRHHWQTGTLPADAAQFDYKINARSLSRWDREG